VNNPGVYVSHVETSAAPLVLFFVALVLAGVLVLAVMMFVAGGARWKRPVSGILSVLLVAGLVGSFQGMASAASNYDSTEAGQYGEYVANVQVWLAEEHNITADTSTVESLLTREPENVVSERQVVPIQFFYNYTDDEINVMHLSVPVVE